MCMDGFRMASYTKINFKKQWFYVNVLLIRKWIRYQCLFLRLNIRIAILKCCCLCICRTRKFIGSSNCS